MFPYGEILLWNNKAITIESDPVFWRSWFKRKILCVQDVLNAEGNFLTIDEFQKKFKIKINFLHNLQLIAAISSDLKKKAATIEVSWPRKNCLTPSRRTLKTGKTITLIISKIGGKNLRLHINPQRR